MTGSFLFVFSFSIRVTFHLSDTYQQRSCHDKEIGQIEYQPVQPLKGRAETHVIHHISFFAPVVQIGEGAPRQKCVPGFSDLLSLLEQLVYKSGPAPEGQKPAHPDDGGHMAGKPPSRHAVVAESFDPDSTAVQLPGILRRRFLIDLVFYRQVCLEQPQRQLYPYQSHLLIPAW